MLAILMKRKKQRDWLIRLLIKRLVGGLFTHEMRHVVKVV
jgi:hypothetical protein